jgi:hypothetical protein
MDEIINALHLRNWYALAALTLTLAVQLFRKHPKSKELWDKIPDGYRWALPMLSGAVTGFTQAFAAGLGVGAAVLSAIGGAIGISIPAMGLNSLLTEAPVRWNGGAGGSAPPTKPTRMFPSDPPLPGGMVLLLAIGLAFHTSACSPAHSAADVPHDVAIAYAAANAALEVADSAETAYLDSLASPTQDQIDHAAAVVEKLKQARAALIAVHDNFADGRAKLRQALSDLQGAVALAEALGVKVPDKVGKALAAAAEAIK